MYSGSVKLCSYSISLILDFLVAGLVSHRSGTRAECEHKPILQEENMRREEEGIL